MKKIMFDLKAWRKERGLTQIAAAELIGVSRRTVQRIEMGQRVGFIMSFVREKCMSLGK